MRLRSMVVIFLLAFWPVSLVIHNQSSELLTFTIPAILLFFAYKYYRCHSYLYFIPLILIAVITPKLALFPLAFTALDLVLNKSGKKKIFFLGIATVTLIAVFGSFRGQTIFVPDYEAQQKVIRDQQLYPSIFTARLFHNKARIILDKANDNFFALIDPNNYFFGFAPRQIVENQNLIKFPFLALPFLLFGVFYLGKHKDKDFLIISLISGLVTLSIVNNFDKNDFLLFVPLILILIHGMKMFEKRFGVKSKYYYAVFAVFSVVELIRIFI